MREAEGVEAGTSEEVAGVRRGRPRSERKREAILAAALDLFLRKGFTATTMDEVATRAAVSKPTVYGHFVDKTRLFSAVVDHGVGAAEASTHAMVASLGESSDLAGDLRRFARHHIVDVTQPELLQLRRIVIAEADRFPELARHWYADTAQTAHRVLGEQFARLHERGLLHVPDPLLAAEYVNWLILSIPLNRALFHGSDVVFGPGELRRYADEAVRIFLAAYGTSSR